MHGCSTRLVAFSAALVLATGVLAWSLSTISSSLGSLFPSDADNQAIRIALQQQELQLEQQRADWERGQAEANALLPALVLTKSALMLLSVVVVVGLLAIAADSYLRYRARELARQARYVVINGQRWLLPPPREHGQRAILNAGGPDARSPVPPAPGGRPSPVDLDPVWTDHPAQYGPEDQLRQHIHYYNLSSPQDQED